MKTKKTIKKLIPKNPKIDGSEDFVKTAVALILKNLDSNPEIIFEKRASGISQGGEISFPGGKFDADKDKTLKDTAVRETVEELGIKESDFEIIGELDSLLAPIGAMITPYLGVLNDSVKIIGFNKSEVDYVFSVPVEWFVKNPPEVYHTILKAHPYIIKKNVKVELLPSKKLGLPEKYHHPWGKLKQKVFVYRYNDEIIWGLTARIVNTFIRKWVQCKES